jgi:hypothetical protein
MNRAFEMDLLQRVLKPDDGGLSPDAAKYFLDIRVEEKDHARMAELNGKANLGTLTKEEDEELRLYILFCDALAILHAKSRISLKKQNTAA